MTPAGGSLLMAIIKVLGSEGILRPEKGRAGQGRELDEADRC